METIEASLKILLQAAEEKKALAQDIADRITEEKRRLEDERKECADETKLCEEIQVTTRCPLVYLRPSHSFPFLLSTAAGHCCCEASRDGIRPCPR